MQIAERILDNRRAVLHRPAQTTVTASIGIAIADDDATPENLLRDATAAMYLAKSRGRTGSSCSTRCCGQGQRVDGQHVGTAQRAGSRGVRRALPAGRRPHHRRAAQRRGAGALGTPRSRVRRPDDFIPLAEETGLIVPIGAMVLEQACEQLATGNRPIPAMTVAVNLSVRQIVSADIVDMVANALPRNGIHPGASAWRSPRASS